MLTMTEFEKLTGIKFTKNHNDKMAGLSSLSTSPLCNGLCESRTHNPDMICAHCYSQTMQKRFRGLREKLVKNSELLTNRILSDEEIPFIISETGMFRLEAFGDLINEIQVVNYFKLVSANPHMKCALWTKNPWIIQSAIETYGIVKPENLSIIGSSYYLNKPMTDFYQKYDFIDNVFTVYTRAFAKAHNVTISCGGRSCKECKNCYCKSHQSYEINELLK